MESLWSKYSQWLLSDAIDNAWEVSDLNWLTTYVYESWNREFGLYICAYIVCQNGMKLEVKFGEFGISIWPTWAYFYQTLDGKKVQKASSSLSHWHWIGVGTEVTWTKGHSELHWTILWLNRIPLTIVWILKYFCNNFTWLWIFLKYYGVKASWLKVQTIVRVL